MFIDGSNLYFNMKKYKLNFRIEDIVSVVENKRIVKDIFYYTALLDKKIDEGKYLSHKKFIDEISKISNLTVRVSELRKVVLNDGVVEYSIKGDDVYLATDLVKGCYEDLYDIAIIVSGDADFIPAIDLVRSKGKKVINAYFPDSSSFRLRKSVDGSVNLKKELIKKRSQYGKP